MIGHAADFLPGASEAARLIRAFDWSATPLGPIETWPQSLKTATAIIVQSPVPIVMLWGIDGYMIYNDAYSVFAGRRHPEQLGRKVRDGWPEVSDFNDNVMKVGLAGRTLSYKDQELTLHRNGEPEQVWMNLDYSPVLDESGQAAGVIAIVVETTERVRAERQQREAKAMLQVERDRAQGVLENMAEAFVLLDRGLRVVDINAEGMRLEGRSKAEIIGKTQSEAWPSTAMSQVSAICRQALAQDVPTALEHRYVWADGRVTWLDLRVYPAPDGLALFYRDVTQRKRDEEALQSGEQRQRQLIESLPQLVWSCRPDGNCDYLSVQWMDYTGIPEEEQLGLAWLDRVMHPDDRDRTYAHWMGAVEGEHPYDIDYRLRRHDGIYHWFKTRGAAIRNADGIVVQWFGTCTDIQEIVEAREVLAQSREDLEEQIAERTRALRLADARKHAMFGATRQLLGLLNLDGTLSEANRAALDAIGAKASDVIGMPFWQAPWFNGTPGMPEVVKGALEEARSGRGVRTEMALSLPDGSTRNYDFAMTPVFDDSGRVVEMVPEAADITDQRRAEEQLRQSQKMEAVGQLTGGLAHDFNNLLTGITGSLELLQTRVAQGRIGDVDRYVTAAQGAARRAAALTHRLLAFSRRQTLDPKPTDVNRLVANMEELIRRTMGPQINIEPVAGGGLWTTLVDPGQLENALLNLCINARDAMPGGGKLSIETANRWLDERAAKERDLLAGQYVSLCVSDNGTGMPPETVARAFDPFFTTKPIGQGTGLGLSMIYGFVRQSGGHVRIYSEVGQGTMVCLYLPRHFGEAETADLPAELLEAPRAEQGETVLVVDDEPTVRMLVTEVLEDLGYTAIEAVDGSGALKVLQSDVRLDLLVTDVGLPGGMNGRQLADAARVSRPHLKVLFITGYAENAVISHGHLEPGMQVMTKPFAMEALATRIRGLIEASSDSRRQAR